MTIPDIMKTKLSTNDSKLLMFNYKLINRLMNNGVNLFRWNIVTDPNCTLCEGGQIDNTYHAIMQCKWTFDKIKIILENLDPSRAWAKFIDHKKWVFGTCDPAINLITKRANVKRSRSSGRQAFPNRRRSSGRRSSSGIPGRPTPAPFTAFTHRCG